MTDTSLTYASIEQTLAALEKGNITSERLVENQLGRVDAFDTKLHAYVDVYADEALQAARGLDKLRQAGFTVLNTELVDYPGRFNQRAYREKLAQLVDQAR